MPKRKLIRVEKQRHETGHGHWRSVKSQNGKEQRASEENRELGAADCQTSKQD
jgi:hypothetical protein